LFEAEIIGTIFLDYSTLSSDLLFFICYFSSTAEKEPSKVSFGRYGDLLFI